MQPIVTKDLAWHKAILVWGVKLTPEERAAGWPGAFTPENLVRLQYPWEGDAVAKRRAKRGQEALWATMKKGIQDGTLLTVDGSRAIVEYAPTPVFDYSSRRSSGATVMVAGMTARLVGPPRTIKKRTGEKIETFRAIERATFRDFLAAQGEAPSEHIAAWFRPLAPLVESQEEQAPQMPKRERRADLVEYCLSECERLAGEKNKTFDRHCMPGKKADFVALLRRLEPTFKDLSEATLLDYIKSAACKWPQPPRRDADAKPLYCLLFGLQSLQTGVSAIQRKKA